MDRDVESGLHLIFPPVLNLQPQQTEGKNMNEVTRGKTTTRVVNGKVITVPVKELNNRSKLAQAINYSKVVPGRKNEDGQTICLEGI